MTFQTEDYLWIAAQEDRLIHPSLIAFAQKQNKSLIELLEMDKSDFLDSGIDDNTLQTFFQKINKIDIEKYEKIYKIMLEENIDLIRLTDGNFPPNLIGLTDKKHSVLLYRQGKLIPFNRCVAIVGTRNISTPAAELTREISRALARSKFTIVSGVARGTDSIAHRGALSVQGNTIGVLAWMNKPYPPENQMLMKEIRESGCLISENFSQTKYDRFKFLERNAVISGISDILIAIETSASGGTKWQVNLALRQGKTVIAVEPSKSNKLSYDGYQQLVKMGAISAKTSSDIYEIVRKKTSRDDDILENLYVSTDQAYFRTIRKS